MFSSRDVPGQRAEGWGCREGGGGVVTTAVRLWPLGGFPGAAPWAVWAVGGAQR